MREIDNKTLFLIKIVLFTTAVICCFFEFGQIFLISILASCCDLVRLFVAIIIGVIGKNLNSLKITLITSAIISILLIILTYHNLTQSNRIYDMDVIIAQFFATILISFVAFKWKNMTDKILQYLRHFKSFNKEGVIDNIKAISCVVIIGLTAFAVANGYTIIFIILFIIFLIYLLVMSLKQKK